MVVLAHRCEWLEAAFHRAVDPVEVRYVTASEFAGLDSAPSADAMVVVTPVDGSVAAQVEALQRVRAHYRGRLLLIAIESDESLAMAAIRHRVHAYVRRADGGRAVDREIAAYRGACRTVGRSSPLIGGSAAVRKLRDDVELVAPTPSTVLLSGETGTGKELVAQLLHQGSQRSAHRFVCINCAALPDSLLENELFGHERGAYTGASTATAGAFEIANGGTLFLDEVGDMSPFAQAKVLRAIESRRVRRVGGQSEREVNIRIIAASNRLLEERVGRGEFREDLFFRLNVVKMDIPPLRDHPEDVPPLVEHYVRHYEQELGRQVDSIDDAAMRALLLHRWPGNVRELRNVIEGTLVRLRGRRITFADLPADLAGRLKKAEPSERDRLLAALVETRWNKSRAARQLKWSRMTLYRKMTKYHLEEPAVDTRSRDETPPSGVTPAVTA